MTKDLYGAEAGPATMHAPVTTATYDADRWTTVQAFVPRPDEHSLLPAKISKAQAMATVCRALRLIGAREIDIAAWRQIADVTDRQAWHAPDRSPVNWMRQCDLARELGISERHWRRIEHRLAGYGVIARQTADNGYRGRRSGQPRGAPISCGLSLEPALANFRALSGIVQEAALAEEARQELALTARIARRRVGILVASLKDIEMRRWAKGRLDELDGLRPASTRVASFGDLSAWQEALVSLEGDIREAMTPCPPPDQEPPAGPAAPSERPSAPADDAGSARNGPYVVENPVEHVRNQQDMSAAPDSGVRCHIQPVQESGSIQHEKNAKREPADEQNPTLGIRMTEQDMRDLASDDVALYLDSMKDWQEALPHVLRELGINVSAWHEASAEMGPPMAFIALLIIDRNRAHPDSPIRNPGGALRAMTRNAREGRLNLAGSILGIRDRQRKGRQPKTPAPPRKPS